ncbi:MAG: hypothetical protein DRN49_01795 [Thaumarchaeota archaeon]|nr:MAG: hypothetical protein DRN49_01795 [Nitrososphaerota archaeon]
MGFLEDLITDSVMGFLEEFSADDVEYMIQENIDIEDLYSEDMKDDLLEIFEKIRPYLDEESINKVTLEDMLKWTLHNRPDLYEVLSSPRGRVWLNRQANKVKKLLISLL